MDNLPSDGLSLIKSREKWFLKETASDVVVQVEGVRFPLHKVLLVSRSGLLRRLVKEKEDVDSLELKLEHVPGGAFGFELAARFCYGVKVDITAVNVALLLCVGKHLEMTEGLGTNNLILTAQTFMDDVFQMDFKSTVRILHSCQTLLPLAESLQVVSRGVDSIVSLLLTSTRTAPPSSTRSSIDTISLYSADTSTEPDHTSGPSSCRSSNDFNSNSWMDDLSSLSIYFYEKIIKSLSSKAYLPPQTIARSLIHYTHKCMERLAQQHSSKEVLQQEERRVIETIVKLLPSDRNVVAFSFLMELLRTTLLLHLPKLRLDLERIIAPRLHHATLDDILIPLLNHEEQLGGGGGDGGNVSTIYDVEATRRLIAMFMQLYEDGELSPCSDMDEGTEGSRKTSIVTKVGYLVDRYLAEIATDANLSPTEFAAVAELLPEHARALNDGLYRAIDMYLKAHPTLKEDERKEVCKMLDFHKLSHDACTHIAQNKRLPLPIVVQVLHLEQMRIDDDISGGSSHQVVLQGRAHALPPGTAPPPLYVPPSNSHSHNSSSHGGSLIVHPANGSSSSNSTDHYASVRRENMELKLEVARMRMRLCDIEKEHTNMKQGIVKTHHISPQHHSTGNEKHHHHHHGGGRFFHAVSKTLTKLNVFHHSHKQQQQQQQQQQHCHEEHSDDHRRRHRHDEYHCRRQSGSPDSHSYHSSTHQKSPSGRHWKSPTTTSPDDHSSNHSHHNGSCSIDRHSNRSQHKSTSSERHHRRGSRHRHHSPSSEHPRTHQSHKTSEHDDHHHRSHHRHHSPSINSSRSPTPERHHHSHNHHSHTPEHRHCNQNRHSYTPERHHSNHHCSPTPEHRHHSHHRSPTPECRHHSHHRRPTPERCHHSLHRRSPTPECHHHSHHHSPTPERHHHSHHHHSPTPERHHHSPTPERHHRSHHHRRHRSPSQEHRNHRHHKSHDTHHHNSRSPDRHHHGKTHHTDSLQDDQNHHHQDHHHRTHQHHHKNHDDDYYDEHDNHHEGHHNPHPPHHPELQIKPTL